MGRPKKYNELSEMQRKIDEYFKICEDKKEVCTVTGLCLALDITRETLLQYEKDNKFSDTIKKAKLNIENFLEKCLFGNNVTGVIFNLKNNFGWKDKQENINIGMSYEDYIKRVEDVNEY